MIEIGPIESGEVKAITFDFSVDATEGSTLVSPTVTCTVLHGTDATPSAVLVGSATVVGHTVVQLVQPGVVGVNYLVRALVSENTGLRHASAVQLRTVAGQW